MSTNPQDNIDLDRDDDSPKSPARRRLLSGLAAAAIFGAAGYGHEIEPERIGVTRLDVRIPGLPEAAAGLRIGHMGDLHCDSDRSVARTERAVALLQAEKPDAVLLLGDFITFHRDPWVERGVAALAPLAAAPLGAYAVPGNHDWWHGGVSLLTRAMAQCGIHMLRNASLPLPGLPKLWIVGVDDVWVKRDDAAAALAGVPGDAVKLLLVHEPDYADFAPPIFSLQFSGHSHAGQIRLPGLPPIHTPPMGRRYPEGLQQARNFPVFTTRGVGMVGPKFRLFCPPEVAVIRLLPG